MSYISIRRSKKLQEADPKVPVLRVLVDDDDYDLVCHQLWRVTVKKKWNNLSEDTFVAYRNVTVNGKQRKIWLHHVILPKKKGFKVRFTNGDGMDCCRDNLEYVPIKPNSEPGDEEDEGSPTPPCGPAPDVPAAPTPAPEPRLEDHLGDAAFWERYFESLPDEVPAVGVGGAK